LNQFIFSNTSDEDNREEAKLDYLTERRIDYNKDCYYQFQFKEKQINYKESLASGKRFKLESNIDLERQDSTLNLRKISSFNITNETVYNLVPAHERMIRDIRFVDWVEKYLENIRIDTHENSLLQGWYRQEKLMNIQRQVLKLISRMKYFMYNKLGSIIRRDLPIGSFLPYR